MGQFVEGAGLLEEINTSQAPLVSTLKAYPDLSEWTLHPRTLRKYLRALSNPEFAFYPHHHEYHYSIIHD